MEYIRFLATLTIVTIMLGCSESGGFISSIYGEYTLTKSEFVGSKVSISGILILTSNSIEMYLDFTDTNKDVISLQSVVHYGVSSSGRKTITAVKTGLILEYYRSEGLLVTVIKDEDGILRLSWRMEISY